MHTRGLVKTSGFTRGVCVKIGDFIKFKGFSCGIPREQAILRKSKAPRKSPEKWTFLSLAFYNAPSLDTVEFLKEAKLGCGVGVRDCVGDFLLSSRLLFSIVQDTAHLDPLSSAGLGSCALASAGEEEKKTINIPRIWESETAAGNRVAAINRSMRNDNKFSRQ